MFSIVIMINKFVKFSKQSKFRRAVGFCEWRQVTSAVKNALIVTSNLCCIGFIRCLWWLDIDFIIFIEQRPCKQQLVDIYSSSVNQQSSDVRYIDPINKFVQLRWICGPTWLSFYGCHGNSMADVNGCLFVYRANKNCSLRAIVKMKQSKSPRARITILLFWLSFQHN